MSEIFRSEHYKDGKHNDRNYQNARSRKQTIKVADSKIDVGKRKGLSENRVTCSDSRQVIDKSVTRKNSFHIYHDDENDENNRSRSRVRKDVCRRKLKAKRDSETERIPTSTDASKQVTEKKSVDFVLRIPRRARSSSNSRNEIVDRRNNKLSSKCFQRSNSESRKPISQPVHNATISFKTCTSQIKNFVSDEVKKRTFSSIQLWKDKMRKQCTGTIPKNFGNVHSNALSVNRLQRKSKSQENSIFGHNKILHRKSSATANNFDDNIEKQANSKATSIDDGLQEIVRKYSNEVAEYLKNIDFSNSEVKVNRSDSEDDLYRNYDKHNENCLQNRIKNNIETTLDDSIACTSKKVRFDKNNDSDNIEYRVPCYLQDMLNIECKREELAPKLSSRFLRENVNAEQRKVVVAYLIRLSMHCDYSSHIIYQSVKLFDVIIDKISVETDHIQLIALACLWINLKREGTLNELPSATAILELAEDMYIGQEKQLFMYEQKILSTVNFNICFADPFPLLFYYIWRASDCDKDNNIKVNDTSLIYFCGSYLLDVTMLDERLCDVSGYILALAAIEISLNLIYLYKINMNKTCQSWYQSWYQSWRNENRLKEWEERTIIFTKQNMIQQVLKSKVDFGLKIVYKKYLRSKHGKVSDFLINRMFFSHEKYVKKSFNFEQ